MRWCAKNSSLLQIRVMILVKLILIKWGHKLSLAMRNIFPNYFCEGLMGGNTDWQTHFKVALNYSKWLLKVSNLCFNRNTDDKKAPSKRKFRIPLYESQSRHPAVSTTPSTPPNKMMSFRKIVWPIFSLVILMKIILIKNCFLSSALQLVIGGTSVQIQHQQWSTLVTPFSHTRWHCYTLPLTHILI